MFFPLRNQLDSSSGICIDLGLVIPWIGNWSNFSVDNVIHGCVSPGLFGCVGLVLEVLISSALGPIGLGVGVGDFDGLGLHFWS